MKPFHYNQDPLYAAAAGILTGQQPLTEEIVAFKNAGFKLLNGLMSDDEIHDAINSSIKSNTQKIGDRTWDVVTDIYGKRKMKFSGQVKGEWGSDWILQRKGGGAWLTVKDGGLLKAHDSISSVVDEFKLQEEIDEQSDGDFKSLIGKRVYHGSPGYPTKEVILSVSPHKTKKGSFEVEFESGVFDVLSGDELDELMNGVEVHYRSPHGGLTVIELQEEEDFHSQKMIKNQLQTIVRNSNSCLQMVEDGREFPEWAQSEIAVAEDGIVSVTEFMQSHHDDSTISEEKWPTVKIVATDDHGLIRKGQTFVTTAETNSMGQTRLVIRDQDMPRMTMHPTLFLDKDGNPNGAGAWKRFAIVQQNDMTEASKFNMGTATITRAGHTLDGKKVQIFHKFDDGRINAQYVKSDKKGDVLNLTLKQDEYKLDEASADTDFYRLPGHIINNELYVAVRNLNAMQNSLKNGNDFDIKNFKKLIGNLNDIAKQAKSFNASDKIPVSYQYTVK